MGGVCPCLVKPNPEPRTPDKFLAVLERRRLEHEAKEDARLAKLKLWWTKD